ncbi:WYL domain-containing protein [Corynebacterium aquatimens]|uniref:helix-turn-helix transcriptional regulator n=1 Tax=Corynebacterium TaxID=1716 RepID=UPI001F3F032E|nr:MULTISPECIES: WYL domain-containing protein [Corynebacterium]QYH19743.1 WYL domain-containing protein [Corynebacterium aquatimens]UIZ93144.1 WYL domain-containing protein [Corynebacterium sp. CNCTC7651]
MAESDAVRRLVNLTFALLGSDKPRSIAWVGDNVDGYEGRSYEALDKQIRTDIKDLRRMWIPVHITNGELTLNKERYELAPVELTEAEATAIGLAADLAEGANLGAFARSGWTKLAASGATRTFDSPAISSVSNDITRLDPETLRRLLFAVRKPARLTFTFTPAAGAPTQQRTVDPWGIVPLNNRAYLVGWDVDRGAERVFRIHKISNVRYREVGDFHSAQGDLQTVVEKLLRGPVADAEVTVAAGAGDALAVRGERDGNVIRLRGVERDWLVRTIASLAGSVVAVEPEDVRRDVAALLHAAAGQKGAAE